VPDFSALLHELRSRELRRLPPGAATVLHGGSAGRWYFDWFEELYPTPARRHIGIDALNPRPPDVPAEIDWLQRSLGDLAPVGTGEVDLVFAGQVIEHLWPGEVVRFLQESSRVLRPGGRMALDSPNRRVTTALGWEHPEHTVEFRPDEIVELLELAGFDEISVRGLWLCFDAREQRFLPLEGASADGAWTVERRADAAEPRPDDSFVWWAEAVRGDQFVDLERLRLRVAEIYADYRSFRFGRLQHAVGVESGVGVDRLVSARAGEYGYLVFGPYVPMERGRWRARFRVAAGGPGEEADGVLGVADVVVGPDAEVIEVYEITPEVLPADGRLREIVVPFELSRPESGMEFRVRSAGAVSLSALLHVVIEPA
jgi:SAM-dependent methyltransferase